MQKRDIKKILIPFDGSKFSKKAIFHAITLAKKFDSDIYIITVVPSNSNPPPSKILGILTNDKQAQIGYHQTICALRIELKNMLVEIVKNCKKENVSAKFEILEGNPIEQIIQFSKKGKCDLIVIGSHGVTGLTKIQALGSVARAISEVASCPVLLIRNNTY